jgi:hypothetical protein
MVGTTRTVQGRSPVAGSAQRINEKSLGDNQHSGPDQIGRVIPNAYLYEQLIFYCFYPG